MRAAREKFSEYFGQHARTQTRIQKSSSYEAPKMSV